MCSFDMCNKSVKIKWIQKFLDPTITVDNQITVIGITVIDTYYRYHDLLVSFNADSMFTNRQTIMVSYIRFDKW